MVSAVYSANYSNVNECYFLPHKSFIIQIKVKGIIHNAFFYSEQKHLSQLD